LRQKLEQNFCSALKKQNAEQKNTLLQTAGCLS